MKKTILSFILTVFVVTGLLGANVNAEEIYWDVDGYNLLDEDLNEDREIFELLTPETIAYSNSDGRTPVVGLDDGRTYNILFASNPKQAMTVSNNMFQDWHLITVNQLTEASNQEWEFHRQPSWEEGVYRIHPVSHQDGGITIFSETPARIAIRPGGSGLLFKVVRNENGYYEFINMHPTSNPNGFLGLVNGVSTNNAQVMVTADHALNERQWILYPEPTPPTQSTLTVLLEVEEELQLSVTNNLADNIDLTWTSSDESVATVDSNGRVTAVSEGTAYIWARNEEEYEDFIPVIVVGEGEAKDLRLAVHLNVGESTRLFMNEDNANVTWSSLDTNTAIVGNNGRVTAISEDLTIITAEYEGVVETIYVRVV